MMRHMPTLWLLGLRESLNIHRCVVFLVLDNSNALGKSIIQCLLLNGAIMLGSTILWEQLLSPAVIWALHYLVAPCLGPLTEQAVRGGLQAAYQGLWAAPVYLVTMLVSCGLYNDIARIAYRVKQAQLGSTQLPGSPGSRAVKTSTVSAAANGAGANASSSSGSGGGLTNMAQEVYRVVLFCVFFAEVNAVGRLPYVGRALNVLFLSWLYAYYCYDYKWGLQGVRLPERLAYFERRWAFFAGFGLPMALSTVLLSFYQGAAVLALLFPVYILVSCDSDVNAVHDRVVGKGGISHVRHLPIFALALWPTQRIVSLVTGSPGAHPIPASILI